MSAGVSIGGTFPSSVCMTAAEKELSKYGNDGSSGPWLSPMTVKTLRDVLDSNIWEWRRQVLSLCLPRRLLYIYC